VNKLVELAHTLNPPSLQAFPSLSKPFQALPSLSNYNMVANWLFAIGDATNFNASSSKAFWGCKSINKNGKKSQNTPFITDAKEGDILWFIKSKSNGRVYAVATFTHNAKRELGPLFALTATNEEIGWITTPEIISSGNNWDIEVHYKNMYRVINCDIYLQGSCPRVSSRTNPNDKYGIDWADEHYKIVRYSKAIQIKRKHPLIVLDTIFK